MLFFAANFQPSIGDEDNMHVKFVEAADIGSESVHGRKITYREAEMKLDMDLLREILLYVEDNTGKAYNELRKVEISGWTDDQIGYHIVLAKDGGLLDAKISKLSDEIDPRIVHVTYSIDHLTMRGHEFVESIREPVAWRTVKDGAAKVGAMTVGVLFSIAEAYVGQKVAQYTGINIT